MRRRRGRIPATYTAPHEAAAPPRCSRCDGIREEVETRPWEIDVARLRELQERIANAAPAFGEMVRADADGVEIWACPRCTSLERHVKQARTSKGIRQHVTWKVVAR